MKCYKLIYFTMLLMSLACKYRENSKNVNENSSKVNNASVVHKAVQSKMKFDTTGFFGECEKMISGSSVGALQGSIHSADSTGYLCFLECYECKETYEIILILKGGVEKRKMLGYDGIEKHFDSTCASKFGDFDCFAFVLPMRDPGKQKDMHEMNISFPVTMKIYARVTSDYWKFIKAVKVKSFEEYGEFQFNTIYGLR